MHVNKCHGAYWHYPYRVSADLQQQCNQGVVEYKMCPDIDDILYVLTAILLCIVMYTPGDTVVWQTND